MTEEKKENNPEIVNEWIFNVFENYYDVFEVFCSHTWKVTHINFDKEQAVLKCSVCDMEMIINNQMRGHISLHQIERLMSCEDNLVVEILT